MTAYQQMGHHADNLLGDPLLSGYAGAILSPVNYRMTDVARQISQHAQNLDLVFDPQLYYPQTEREILRNWTYFPSDVDTADVSSPAWWRRLVADLASTCGYLRPAAACSPAIVPRAYRNEYYSLMVDAASWFADGLVGTGVRPIQTAIASLADLSVEGRPYEIASIISRTPVEEVYLVLVSDVEPRRELSDPEAIKGAMRLISALTNSGMRVIVGYSSSDLILWKSAGATACASGKFFNLRRFTSSRFEEPSQGGGQLPYWFEESLVAFLRESDIVRLQRADLLGLGAETNPYARQILERLTAQPGTAWIALGWRQFMFGFADLERRISEGAVDVASLLAAAERKWLSVTDDHQILMEEQRNDGAWLRAWRRAVIEYA